jgi:predicted dithiol-disulfide oxidoreductase (DUF899 family)
MRRSSRDGATNWPPGAAPCLGYKSKDYTFDAPDCKVTLAGLFNGRSQLSIKRFMMGSGQVGQCVGCSLEVDHLEGMLVHCRATMSATPSWRAPMLRVEKAIRSRISQQQITERKRYAKDHPMLVVQ